KILDRPRLVDLVDGEVLALVREPERLLDHRMVQWWARLREFVSAPSPLDARLCLRFVLGAMEREPVRLDPLPGHAAALDQPPLDICLDVEQPPPCLGCTRHVIEDGVAPGNMRLTHRRQL